MISHLQQAFWFLVTIAILIPIHEYGHYRVAKACGVKVLRFSVGFGNVLWSRRVGPDQTEFALSMIPLGGYVKMLDEREGPVGDVDLPRCFNRRPLYQRALVVAAGPFANLALAVALFAFVQWYGVDMPTPIVGTPAAGSLMADAGLQRGDRIVAITQGLDGGDDDFRAVRSWDDVADALEGAVVAHEPLRLRVTRDSGATTRTLTAAIDQIDPFSAPKPGDRTLGLGLIARIGTIAPDGAAASSGLQVDDLVLRIDGKPVDDASAVRAAIVASGASGTPRPMSWEVERAGQVVAVAVTARMETVGQAAVARAGIGFEHGIVRAGVVEAVQLGAVQTWRQAKSRLQIFAMMLTGQLSTKAIGGPGTIAVAASASAQQGLTYFVGFLAMVSLGLGVLNLLPIPMLDGGTLLYYLFEGATGRPVSELWQIWLQRGGALILLLLMTLALSNDVVRYLGPQ
jgi:regulator of sigma E protease